MTIEGKKRLRAFTLAALTATTLVASAKPAHAEPVSPSAKGIVGGALLGGELVVFGEAIFGVRSTAAYLIGAGIGAAGGGVGGYFIEEAVDDGRIPAYMLAGGLAALIPAVVVTLDATRYMPTEGAREDKPVGPPSDPGRPGGSSVVGAEPGTPPATSPGPVGPGSTGPTSAPPSDTAPPAPAPPPTTPGGGGSGGGTQQAPRAPQSSLFNVREGQFAVGMPIPEVRPVLGSVERTRMGVENRGSELRFPVVRVTF